MLKIPILIIKTWKTVRKIKVFLYFFLFLWYNVGKKKGEVRMNKHDDYEEYEVYADYDEEEVIEDEENAKNTTAVVSTLAIVSKGFIYIGVIITIILFLYFIFSLKFSSAVLFILGLVIAYFFGYFFMFCLDIFISNN